MLIYYLASKHQKQLVYIRGDIDLHSHYSLHLFRSISSFDIILLYFYNCRYKEIYQNLKTISINSYVCTCFDSRTCVRESINLCVISFYRYNLLYFVDLEQIQLVITLLRSNTIQIYLTPNCVIKSQIWFDSTTKTRRSSC